MLNWGGGGGSLEKMKVEMVVKVEVVRVEVVVEGMLVLSTELHFVENPIPFPLRPSKEVKSMGYIRDLPFFIPVILFHFM